MIEICIQKKLRDYSLDVDIRMETCGTLVLLGENGAGKSTILNLVAGLMAPDTGSIRIGNMTVVDTVSGVCLPPESRRTGYVFQDYALFPHMTVAENIAFGLIARNHTKGEAGLLVRQLAERFGLLPVLHEPARSISGGQRQRVALARALAVQPGILLLDEPFSSLDIGTRAEVRSEVRSIIAGAGIPAIVVTHDIHDAVALGDRICLMDRGRIVLSGDAATILTKGQHPFIDQFFIGMCRKPQGSRCGPDNRPDPVVVNLFEF